MFNLKAIILDETQYVSGFVNKEDDYVISASMVGKEAIQNYLSIVHGKIHNEEIDDTTLGSVFHLGMETMMNKWMKENPASPMFTEHSMDVKLSNGWVLSGTADLILKNETDGTVEIRDYKLTKSYAKTMMKKELMNHTYTKQLQVLDALWHESKKDELPTILVCDMFIKDAKAADYELSHEPVVVPNKIGAEGMDAHEVLFGEVVAQTDSLQSYIESGTVPPECNDKWIRKIKGVTIPTKCAFYCSHGKAGLCPYYNATSRTAVNRLANW